MIHGHSIIELTNVKTGEVERYDDDNLVTNGLQYYSCRNSVPSDVWHDLFSGLRLYDSALVESVDTFFAPLNVEQVGYAGLNADTTDPLRGLFNAAESGVLDDLSGVKLVWDFAQSQANGTISCIGITPNTYIDVDSKKGSTYRPKKQYTGYNSVVIGNVANTDVLDYDFTKGVVTTYSSDKQKSQICISNTYARIYYRSILDSLDFYKLLSDEYIAIPELAPAYLTEAIFLGGDSIYFYFVALKSYSTSKEPYVSIFLLIKIKKDTHEVLTREFQFSEGAYPQNYFYATSKNNALKSSFIMNGFLYLSNVEDFKFYKFQLSDLAFLKIIESNEIKRAISGASSVLVREDGALLNGVSIDLDDKLHPDKWFYNEISSSTDSLSGKKILSLSRGHFGLLTESNRLYYYMPAMLFTINNLSTPVTKTADKTMKITYILKEDYGDTPQTP